MKHPLNLVSCEPTRRERTQTLHPTIHRVEGDMITAPIDDPVLIYDPHIISSKNTAVEHNQDGIDLFDERVHQILHLL